MKSYKLYLIIFFGMILDSSTNTLLAVPLGLVSEESVVDYSADLSIYSVVYDVDPSNVLTHRDLLNLVADTTGLNTVGFQSFICMTNLWASSSVSDSTGTDEGWKVTIIGLKPNRYFTPDLSKLLDENVLDALNSGNMQIIYQYTE